MLLCVSCKVETVCREQEKVCCRVVFDAMDSLTVQGVERDSLLYANSKSISSIDLPLRSDTTCTAYRLIFGGEEHILTLQHTNEPTFISLACGCFVYHTIEEASLSAFPADSVEILNASVGNRVEQNIRLHLPKTPVAE